MSIPTKVVTPTPPLPAAATEPLVAARPPAGKGPSTPPGSTHDAKAPNLDEGRFDKAPPKEGGPEFPLNPSARRATVSTWEDMPDTVMDVGLEPEETGQELPSADDAPPRAKPASEPDDPA